MSISDTRPPWLPDDLETLVFDSRLTICFNDLRESRHDCPLVGQVLSAVLRRLPTASAQAPSEFEIRMARQHIAVELQNILKRWCEEGLEKTLQGSFLRMFSGMEGSANNNGIMGMGGGARTDRKDLMVRSSFRTPPSALSSPAQIYLDRNLVDTQPHAQDYHSRAESIGSGSSLIPSKRASEDDEHMMGTSNKAGRFYTAGAEAGGEKDFRCPYNVRNPNTHPDCAGKRFPNPRKLKEHIWRFTKPFKCPTCNEGFGREKTKAIHCEQRKVKCVASERNDYEGSLEQARDKQIDRAKNTPEIISIFEQYESNYQSTFLTHNSFVPSPADTSDRGSPCSDESGSPTPVATPASNNYSWTTPQPQRNQPPPVLRIPQHAEKSGYPTPPGDRTTFSPHPHHDMGGGQQQQRQQQPQPSSLQPSSLQPSMNLNECGSPFQTVPMVAFPEATSSDAAVAAAAAAYSDEMMLSQLDIPDIIVTEMNPIMHSPLTPAGGSYRPPMHSFPVQMDMSPTNSRRTSMVMGPPPPRQQQHQHQQRQQHQPTNTYGGDAGSQQGEVISFGYKSIPPVRFRMKF